jgi:hypothetical protein
VATACRHHRKAAGARPVHQIADQGRLVAKGQRIHHAGSCCLAGQQRAAEGIGLDGHIHHMLAVGKGFQAMVYRRNRVAGAFHDDIDRRVADQRLPVVADVGLCLT